MHVLIRDEDNQVFKLTATSIMVDSDGFNDVFILEGERNIESFESNETPPFRTRIEYQPEEGDLSVSYCELTSIICGEYLTIVTCTELVDPPA